MNYGQLKDTLIAKIEQEFYNYSWTIHHFWRVVQPKTGVEFAMFTKGNERMIVRGNSVSVNIDIDKARELAYNGYKWSGHTHPGVDYNCMFASDNDYVILGAFKQNKSVTYNSLGQHLTFELEWNKWRFSKGTKQNWKLIAIKIC